MLSFNRILVDIDALAPLHPALSQAVDLARRADAALTVVDVVEDVPSEARAYVSPSMEADILGSRTRRLEAAVEKHRGKCPSIQGRILRGKPSVALIQEVLRGRHDLLVRYHGRDLKAERGYGAVDMQLLRKCPCPVWLVGVGEKTRPKRVMAAVHPDPQHPEARALNRRIIHAAAELARLEK
ncbi:MAG: universal stress protein, partial [Vicinamibacterales bacterium]